jgi:DNA-binding LacI/PurR family transcriptional regulator
MVHATTTPALPEQLSWLCQFKKPVVWLDMDSKAPQWNRKKIGRSNFFRCHSDEQKAVGLAVDYLHAAGHRTVGFPKYIPYTHLTFFVDERIAHARNRIASQGYDMEIVVPPLAPEPWDNWPDTSDNEIFDVLSDIRIENRKKHAALHGARFEHALGKDLLRRTPTLQTLLAGSQVTAIIAANEWLAITYFYWLKYAGLSIPRDLSIIGFDNHRRFMQHPTATLDLKLDELGYLAAHLLIGDIPVRHDRKGNVAAQPQFIDRGALGPAREGKLRI